MDGENFQTELDSISQLLQQTQAMMMDAQGKSAELEKSILQLTEVENQLNQLQNSHQINTNPQYQQAREQLHDLRRNINHYLQ
ncbi:hypothetical protein [Paraliobacillus salinarum]|uniref:hypothetical protein n=1 Tax=Paraliobacillus salinarum TaxID=1158996 RepID=UPI0015F62A50|nr:hypothetical protein [Paraliobacillus salinarum]